MVDLNYQCVEELISKDMPLLKGPMLRILKLLENPNSSTTAIANAIGNDPGIATKVLRVANSPLFNAGRTITSLKNAVLSLGQKRLYDMVMLMSTADFFNLSSTPNAIEDRLWKHSLAVGYAAQELLIMQGKPGGEEAFLCGLLHDIGKLLFLRHDPALYRIKSQEEEIDDYELIEREISTYGFSHAQLGWLAAGQWDLPVNICEVIACHHYAGREEPDSPIAIAIEAADCLTSHIGFGVHNKRKPTEELEDIWAILAIRLRLSVTKLNLIATATESSMKWLMRLF